MCIAPTELEPSQGGPETPRFGPLHLVNALAACVMSARLHSEHRQWAAEQLLRTLANQGRGHRGHGAGLTEEGGVDCMVDLVGDLPQCPVTTLEAHQNRVTHCTYSARKNLLASR